MTVTKHDNNYGTNINYEVTKRNGAAPLLLQAERRGIKSGSVGDKSLSFTEKSLC